MNWPKGIVALNGWRTWLYCGQTSIATTNLNESQTYTIHKCSHTDIHIEECSSVDVYVDRFRQVCDKIAFAGKTIADSERQFHMLQGVPAKWENYKAMMGMDIGVTDR